MFLARDADPSLEHSRLSYSLEPDKEEELPFTVDPDLGLLVVSAPLDRERRPVYAFWVRATDPGERMARQWAQVFFPPLRHLYFQ